MSGWVERLFYPGRPEGTLRELALSPLAVAMKHTRGRSTPRRSRANRRKASSSGERSPSIENPPPPMARIQRRIGGSVRFIG